MVATSVISVYDEFRLRWGFIDHSAVVFHSYILVCPRFHSVHHRILSAVIGVLTRRQDFIPQYRPFHAGSISAPHVMRIAFLLSASSYFLAIIVAPSYTSFTYFDTESTLSSPFRAYNPMTLASAALDSFSIGVQCPDRGNKVTSLSFAR